MDLKERILIQVSEVCLVLTGIFICYILILLYCELYQLYLVFSVIYVIKLFIMLFNFVYIYIYIYIYI